MVPGYSIWDQLQILTAAPRLSDLDANLFREIRRRVFDSFTGPSIVCSDGCHPKLRQSSN